MVQNIINSTRFDAVMKITFVVVLLPWCVWVTVSIFEQQAFADRGDRFTKIEAHEMKAELVAELHEAEIRIDIRIDELPPKFWQAQVQDALSEVRRLDKLLREHELTIIGAFVQKDELKLILDTAINKELGRKMYNAPAGPTSLKQ